jgi:iron(III) transport system substrate-binding protein
MKRPRISRRDALKAAGGLLAGTALSTRVLAEAPPAEPVTPALIAAARKEGQVIHYTSTDLPVAEKLAKSFEAKYPGIAVRVERTGAERVFQRIGQEYSSNIHAVDVVNSSDAAHFIVWKRDGVLVPFVPEDVAKFYPPEHRDIDGQFASWRIFLSIIAYNTNLVKAEDAPKSFADLLDPKWKGKIVKAHPGYSGTIMTATFEQVRALGWDYFAKLGQQRVMQVQSATEPPKKLALGERPVMADGSEYVMFDLIAAGNPVAVVYPSEGTPLIVGSAAVMKDAPHPNAARLFISFLFSREAQQLMSETGGIRSFHPEVKEPAGRVPLGQIKLITADPLEQVEAIDEIKRKYADYFGT